MGDLNNLERIDKVVDEIVDLQAHLKNDIEARDAKLEKYDKILEEMMNAKLETKINEFNKSLKAMTDVKADLEAKIESNRVKIDRFEKKFGDLEFILETKDAKISSLKARLKTAEKRITNLEDSEIEEAVIAVIEDENVVHSNRNLKREYLTYGNKESHKKMKINEADYTDKIKFLEEILSPNFNPDEICSILSMLQEDSIHLIDNMHCILACASIRSHAQLDLLNKMVREKWSICSTRIKEKLIALLGQIGMETVHSVHSQAKQGDAVNLALTLLWEIAHSPAITRHLLEFTLKEHLNILSILSELNVNRPILDKYILCCVSDIKKSNELMLPKVKHLHDILTNASSYNKTLKHAVLELNKQHEIVKLINTSLNRVHRQAVESAKQLGGVLKPDTRVDTMYTHEESVRIHLNLLQLLLKDGDLYLSWARCEELWNTLITNEDSIKMDQDCLFSWFTTCFTDLEADTQKLFYEKLLSLPVCTVSHSSCLQRYSQGENEVKKN